MPSDIIEGEFRAENKWAGKPSGFYCRRCHCHLLVGEHACGGCGFGLRLTTPPLLFVQGLPVDKQWTFYTDRIDGDELARVQERQRNKHKGWFP